jgi:hypothetical protein
MPKQQEPRPLDDAEIIGLIDAGVRGSVHFHDADLSREREAVLRYYNGEKPATQKRGRSRYVSQDVYDTVEGMKAQLLETFASGEPVGDFRAHSGDDVEAARIASAYTNYVIFEQNPGYDIFQDVIHDGLMARLGVARVWWGEDKQEIEEVVESAGQDDLDALLAEDDVFPGDLDLNEDGTVSGTVTRRVDASRVRIEAVPPEEFGITPRAKSLEDAHVVWQRSKQSRSDLQKEYGDKAKNLESDTLADFETDTEVAARHEDMGSTHATFEALQRQTERIWVYEVFTELDVDGSGEAKLWRVVYAGATLLEKEQVRRRPFLTFTPLRKPHAAIGNNFADKAVPTQNAKTVLTRGILDHTVTTNNPRYQVVTGSLLNPAELMENRFAGIVNVTRPDGVLPLPQASLNPFVYQTIQLLEQDLEDTSGVSRLSQGLNKDALSRQNSADMVEQLTTLSQTRQRVIVRNFANQFVKPLYNLVYELVVENEDRERIIEVADNWTEVNPRTWREKREYVIDLKLGAAARQKEAVMWLEMHGVLSADPTLAPQYGPKQKAAVLHEHYRLRGVPDFERFLVPEPPPQEPNPVEQLQVQQLQQQMEIANRQQQLAEQKAQMDAKEAAQKLHLQAEQAEQDRQLKAAQHELAVRAQLHKEQVNKAELEIAKTAADVRAIASPQG